MREGTRLRAERNGGKRVNGGVRGVSECLKDKKKREEGRGGRREGG